MKSSYTPISCDFYDELEAAATLNTVCQIIYLDENNKPVFVKDEIKDLYATNKEEFVKLSSGLLIRLDKLINFNGKDIR